MTVKYECLTPKFIASRHRTALYSDGTYVDTNHTCTITDDILIPYVWVLSGVLYRLWKEHYPLSLYMEGTIKASVVCTTLTSPGHNWKLLSVNYFNV